MKCPYNIHTNMVTDVVRNVPIS